MVNFNNYDDYANTIRQIYELADIAGKDIIRISTTKTMSIKKLGNFEQLKIGNDRGAILNKPLLTKETLRMYPNRAYRDGDGKSLCHGFVIDTESNRKMLASLLMTGHIDFMDERIKQEIIDTAIELGLPTQPIKTRRQFDKGNSREQLLEKNIDAREQMLEQAELAVRRLTEERDKLKEAQLEYEVKLDEARKVTVSQTIVEDDALITKPVPAKAQTTKKRNTAKKD
ncbi:MAG: hypothetical protein GY941_22140 [Planctomycetes bacterium]|nr:hypothetical protein [Planctomycetota bacterium]